MSLESSVNVTPLVSKKEQLERFEQIPEVKSWLYGSGIKPTIRAYYSKRLFEFLDGEPPKQFLDRALKDPREVSIQIKGRIGKVVKNSPSVGVHTKAAW